MNEIKFGILEFVFGLALAFLAGYLFHGYVNTEPVEIPVQIQTDEPEVPVLEIIDSTEFVPEIGFPPMKRQQIKVHYIYSLRKCKEKPLKLYTNSIQFRVYSGAKMGRILVPFSPQTLK